MVMYHTQTARIKSAYKFLKKYEYKTPIGRPRFSWTSLLQEGYVFAMKFSVSTRLKIKVREFLTTLMDENFCECYGEFLNCSTWYTKLPLSCKELRLTLFRSKPIN
jgi:hypothetical protein